MKLLVLTATRGVSPYFTEAVTSVVAAAPGANHVVVAPPDRLESIAKSSPGLVVVAEVGPGLYPNLNHALKSATGDWDAFTWINDDDLLLPAGFSLLLEEMDRRAELDVGFGRVCLIDGRGRQVGAIPVAHRPADLPSLLAQGIIPLAQPGTVVRRRVLEQVGRFDESYRLAGDMDFFVRALRAGQRFQFTNRFVAGFRLTAGQLSKRRAEVEAETERAVASLRGTASRRMARWRFRFDNCGAYLERIRKHGWKSMREIYDSVT